MLLTTCIDSPDESVSIVDYFDCSDNPWILVVDQFEEITTLKCCGGD